MSGEGSHGVDTDVESTAEADGTVTGIGAHDNHSIYIPSGVTTNNPAYPFETEDPYEVIVLPDTGLLLTPPAESVGLSVLRLALGDRLEHDRPPDEGAPGPPPTDTDAQTD